MTMLFMLLPGSGLSAMRENSFQRDKFLVFDGHALGGFHFDQ